MRPVIVNADDFAMDEGVDRAIVALSLAGTVTAASAMVLSPRWPEAAGAFCDAPLSRGLHLDFTSSFATNRGCGFRLPWLIASAVARRLDGSFFHREIAYQLKLFESAAGKPDFIDGHQHVHHLPVIREALLDCLSERYGEGAKEVALRICAPRRWRGLKAEIIAWTGSRSFERLAAERGHPTNSDFAGVYDFSENESLPALWKRWLSNLEGPMPMIMCHVAMPGSALEVDSIRAARIHEYNWLSSSRFREACRQFSLQPAPWVRECVSDRL